MTYEKCVYDIPPYQEGNLQDFEFYLHDFPLNEVSNITMQVRSVPDNKILISKSLGEGITLDLQNKLITVLFQPTDTIGKAGTHAYEIDFKKSTGPFATIGGSFIINPQINTL